MTQPTPPSSRSPDPRLARDVAKHLDRRRTGRRLVGWTAVLGAIAAAAYYLTCGRGLGLGDFGLGSGGGPAEVRTVTGPRRCAIRVTARGITVDGTAMPRDQAVAACKAADGAEVVVTGDARHGDWTELQAALVEAGLRDIVVHQPRAGSGSSTAR